MRLQFSCRHGLLTATPRHGLLRAKPCAIQWQVRRLSDAVSSESNLVQVYVSRTLNPHINLAIEHRLLQASHPNSTVLFLYTNGPCVVIGRNQNPWLEVNLGLLNRGLPHPSVSRDRDGRQRHDDVDQYQPVVPVQLIRRYSGGGTVFHDEGNVNYSVICPPARFDRDRHAKMVVRALTSLVGSGLGVRVNERHDIVMNGGDHSTPQEGSFKISGSAYKITRTRALHHGTCLLSSPYLHNIGPLLHSPACPYIRARGTESVRSRIRNVFAGGFDNNKFEDAVVGEFRDMYGPPSDTSGSSAVGALTVGAEQLEDPKVLEIYEELMVCPVPCSNGYRPLCLERQREPLLTCFSLPCGRTARPPSSHFRRSRLPRMVARDPLLRKACHLL